MVIPPATTPPSHPTPSPRPHHPINPTTPPPHPHQPVSPTLLFDYPTIDLLSGHLEDLLFNGSKINGSHDGSRRNGSRNGSNRNGSNGHDTNGDAIGIEPALRGGATDGAARDVAVIGMACRFPGGIEGPGMLWDAVREGAWGGRGV